VSSVRDWLERQGLGQYGEAIDENGIDMRSVTMLCSRTILECLQRPVSAFNVLG
jgi:hypothetical protein